MSDLGKQARKARKAAEFLAAPSRFNQVKATPLSSRAIETLIHTVPSLVERILELEERQQ